MDKVFDSVNGSTVNAKDCKPLKCAIKENSPHIDFWHEAIKVFESMVFVNKKTGQKTKQPVCIKNWVITLKSFEYLWLKLKADNLKFLILRNINQDSLECLFGSIRSHGVRYNMPNAMHFLTSFKTLLINNFTSLKSLGNCEANDTERTLDNLKQFITGVTEPGIQNKPMDFGLSSFFFDFSSFETTSIGEMTIGYVSGYIIRTILKSVQYCVLCKDDCVDNANDNQLINARCYSNNNLFKPSSSFNKIVEQIMYILTTTISNICNKPLVFVKLDFLIDTNVDFSFNCKNHDLKTNLKTKIINFFIYTWCKNINRVLSGVDTRVENNPIKKIARDYYVLHRTRKQGYNK